jgi:hypothetical protein
MNLMVKKTHEKIPLDVAEKKKKQPIEHHCRWLNPTLFIGDFGDITIFIPHSKI